MDIFQWQLKKKQSKHLALELAKASPGHLTDEQLNLPFPLKYIQLWHNIFSIAKISEKKSEIVITQFRPNMQFLCFVFVGKGLQIGWNLHQYAKLQILFFVLIVKSAALPSTSISSSSSCSSTTAGESSRRIISTSGSSGLLDGSCGKTQQGEGTHFTVRLKSKWEKMFK